VVEQFLNHIHRHQLCKTTDKILLAISGGIDSMVMADLFLKTRHRIAVAHVNYQLREAESHRDEDFVRTFCSKNNLEFHSLKAETTKIATETRQSVQLAARRIRYDFFKQLIREKAYGFVATAHNLNDNLETIIMNLVRGTGIDGLSGIPLTADYLIRPLLFASREQIMAYADENQISWVEDSSNAKDDYTRNIIRHHVIPQLKNVNANLENTFEDTLTRIKATQNVFASAVDQLRAKATETSIGFSLQIAELSAYRFPEVILWELVKSYGFNFDQCKDMVKKHISGKVYLSTSHRILLDRKTIILEKRIDAKPRCTEISINDKNVETQGTSLILDVTDAQHFELSPDPNVASLDADKITFPLTWRTWVPGDHFFPLGMKGSKKVSDFLIDLKIPVFEKQNISVLESSGNIVWVVGRRISNRYKVTNDTRKVLVIRYTPVSSEIVF